MTNLTGNMADEKKRILSFLMSSSICNGALLGAGLLGWWLFRTRPDDIANGLYYGLLTFLFILFVVWAVIFYRGYLIPAIMEENLKGLSQIGFKYALGGSAWSLVLLSISLTLFIFSKSGGLLWLVSYPLVFFYSITYLADPATGAEKLTHRIKANWGGYLKILFFFGAAPTAAFLFSVLSISYLVLILEKQTAVFSRMGERIEKKQGGTKRQQAD